MNILVINGPNLNLLGEREIDLYGSDSLEELTMWLENAPECLDHQFKFYQSNHEGEIIDILHDERHWTQGIIINPGAIKFAKATPLIVSIERPKAKENTAKKSRELIAGPKIV